MSVDVGACRARVGPCVSKMCPRSTIRIVEVGVASLKFAREAWELRYRDPSGVARRERISRFGRQAAARVAPWTEKPRSNGNFAVGLYVDSRPARSPASRSTTNAGGLRAESPRHAPIPISHARASTSFRTGANGVCATSAHPTSTIGSLKLSKVMGPNSVRHCYTLFRGPVRRAVKDRIIGDPLVDIVLPPKPKIRKSSTTSSPAMKSDG